MSAAHAELVKAAERWLRSGPKKCCVVLSDVRAIVISEQPDAIGWNKRAESFLVECKVSREDALRDRVKPFRREPAMGMGRRRYLLASREVAGLELLCSGWGLLEWDGSRVRKVKESAVFHEIHEDAERALLVSAIVRATEGWGRGMFGDIAPTLVDGDPHPSTAKTMRELRAALRTADAKIAEQEAALEKAGDLIRILRSGPLVMRSEGGAA